MKATVKRSLFVFLLMLLFMALLLLPITILIGPGLMILMLAILILVFPISFSIAAYILYSATRNSEKNRLELLDDGMRIVSSYSDFFPTHDITIPYSNIGSLEDNGEAVWKKMMDETPGHFRLFYRKPYPAKESLFSIFSEPQELMTLRLKTPLMIEKLMPPRGLMDKARTERYHVDRVIVNVERGSQMKLMDELRHMGVDAWRG